MLTFTIIIFGLATVRTISKLTDPKNVTLGTILVAATMIVAYIWFLNQFVS